MTAVGCFGGSSDPDTGKVTGKVIVDGKPGSGLQVIFNPAQGGRTSSGTTNENGEYTLVYSPETLGALIGQHKVTVSAAEPPIDAPTDRKRLESTGFPKKYAENPKQVEVKAGSNTIDLTYP
jgi:hypothetical protein